MNNRAFVLAAAIWCAPACAGDGTDIATTMPKPATITVPDLSARLTERDRFGFADNFYFNKPGVSLETTLADTKFCYVNAPYGLYGQLPSFIPFGRDSDPSTADPVALVLNDKTWGGLLASLIVSATVDDDQRRHFNGNLRRCMMYKGYKRYGASRQAGKYINKGAAGEIITRLALIASGPTPQTDAIEP